MSVTPEQYKDWKKRAEQGTLYFSEMLEEMPQDTWFALGALSSWIFIGSKPMFEVDMDFLDELYFKRMVYNESHIMFLMQKVVDIYARHWENEHLLILIKLEGREEGYITFEHDYQSFRKLCKERLAKGQTLPKNVCFDKNGKVVKRDMSVRPRRKGISPHKYTVILYDLAGEEIERFSSIQALATYLGIPWCSAEKMVHKGRKHPQYRFGVIDEGSKY